MGTRATNSPVVIDAHRVAPARNVIICCDGTNNQFGIENTNVVRLIQVLERDPLKQRMYYDPGVGTLPEAGLFTRLGKWFSKVAGLAFGAGLTTDVLQAYAYIMQTWEPGDRVFIFGFSRGAYTARVLAGMLHRFGLMPRSSHNLLPYIMRNYRALSREKRPADGGMTPLEKTCAEFRRTFARAVTGPADREKYFHVHFLGLWDTVSSVGWAWDPVTFRNTARNRSVEIIRHAMAIDERRWFFRQNRMEKAVPTQDFIQCWFPGVHSDVGGGYPEDEGGLWRMPFEWILDEAAKAGLYVDPTRRAEVLGRQEEPAEPWAEMQHESLTPAWWPAEFFPKFPKQHDAATGTWSGGVWPKIGLGHHRKIRDGELIHRTALLRLKRGPVHLLDGVGRYRPPNISSTFVSTVEDLAEAPEYLAYRADPSSVG